MFSKLINFTNITSKLLIQLIQLSIGYICCLLLNMEVEINDVIKSVYKKDPSVIGVIVVDESGLCLESDKGIPEETAGLFASIINHSDLILKPNSNQNPELSPVVQIEAGSLIIVVKRVLNITMGILKNKAS
ncbi:hypothetical protein COEREDRAFT_5415 [Coemansia reversa NRRL 1564]|uniref:Uncharacterized protein n=1 Tax=Coemansia reversa (strain ATCC 12441 / NRRL 1564) TaxID=763665 RepID=A0A2G5BLF7_COERN|nr:hypothetical protein COEREDRAFT_5415 [Coemansia reversa NRRL 1564]|eukprot:PIA19587.1 hypothetical protein COEREDRAFT_5415 [Coemansia reversa NRRL 1564]